MRDPRLVEIDFLMELERERQLTIIGYGDWNNAKSAYAGAAAKTRTQEPAQLYGTDPVRFLEMINGLLLTRLISGSGHYGAIAGLFRLRKEELVTVGITHAGRVHLWEMRDKLIRDPDIEPFGLRSRAAWDRDLFVRLRWATPEAPLSVLFLDLDNFGAVNKEHGHPVGDAVLRTVFHLVSGTVGIQGAVYRYGGEEVAALLPSIALDRAKDIAEEVRLLVEREVHVQIKALKSPQTVSIGVTSFTTTFENDVAVTKVDELMQAAKARRQESRRGGMTRSLAAEPVTPCGSIASSWRGDVQHARRGRAPAGRGRRRPWRAASSCSSWATSSTQRRGSSAGTASTAPGEPHGCSAGCERTACAA